MKTVKLRKMHNVAVVGAGALVEEVLDTIEKRQFPYKKVRVLDRSKGKILIGNQKYKVKKITAEAFQGIEIALFAEDKNGRNFPIEISLNSMRTDGHIMFTTVIRDVTERKAAEEKIKELAVIDSLTGLSNRHRFQQRLEENINLAERLENKFIVLMMDLDKFCSTHRLQIPDHKRKHK